MSFDDGCIQIATFKIQLVPFVVGDIIFFSIKFPPSRWRGERNQTAKGIFSSTQTHVLGHWTQSMGRI